jgi:hypothetical protein
MSRTKGKNSANREARDFYPTPQWCVDILADYLKYKIIEFASAYQKLTVCDIGAGDGRIGVTCLRKLPSQIGKPSKDFKKRLICVDLSDAPNDTMKKYWIKSDFMKLDLRKVLKNAEFKLYVSNPPFSMSDKIVMKTVEHMHHDNGVSIAAFLLRVNWLGSKKRSEFLKGYPPRKLVVLVPRPSFTGKGTDATEYAWFIWSTHALPGLPIIVKTKRITYRK